MRVTRGECPICGGKNFHTLSSLQDYSIIQCQDCLFCFCNDYQQIDYSNRKELNPESQWRNISQKREYVRKFRHYARIVKRYLKKPESWLDVGANLGFAVLAAQSAGFKASGIEPEHNIAKLAREKYSIDIKQGYLKDLLNKGLSFQIISYYDVLEHISDPLTELKLAHSVLKKNGLIIIKVPNAYREIQQLRDCKDAEFFAPEHKNYFTYYTLRRLLEVANFCVVKYICDEPFYNSLYQLSGQKNKWKIRFFKYILFPLVKVAQFYKSSSIKQCAGLVFFAKKMDDVKNLADFNLNFNADIRKSSASGGNADYRRSLCEER